MEKSKDVILPSSPQWIAEVKAKAQSNMEQYDSCTQSVLAAFMEVFDLKDPYVMRCAGSMHGGMVSSLTCGIHTSAMMVLGLLMGREDIEEGMDGLMPIALPAQRLIERLNEKFGSHSCKELTGTDFTDRRQAIQFSRSGGMEQCIERVGEGAEEIARFIVALDKKGELFRVDTHKNTTREV